MNKEQQQLIELYGEIGASEVWRSWRDNMLKQGRQVKQKYLESPRPSAGAAGWHGQRKGRKMNKAERKWLATNDKGDALHALVTDDRKVVKLWWIRYFGSDVDRLEASPQQWAGLKLLRPSPPQKN